jgi:hypothetical protein
MVTLTPELIAKLNLAGLETFHGVGAGLNDKITFELPFSIKWMNIHYGLVIGAFSYAVNGFFFHVSISRYTSHR